jgi:hypothetical protein
MVSRRTDPFATQREKEKLNGMFTLGRATASKMEKTNQLPGKMKPSQQVSVANDLTTSVPVRSTSNVHLSLLA